MRGAATRPPPRLARTLLVAAVLAVSVPACGGDDDEGSTAAGRDGQEVARTEAAGPASPEESVRSYGTKADADSGAAIETAVKDFYAAKAAG